MITFWIFAIAMVVVALVFILRPLLLELNKNDVDRVAQNVAITKERLNELKLELEQDTITQAEYEQTKEELEQALLNDIEESNVKLKSTSNVLYTRFTRYLLIVSVPVLAVGFYAFLGTPDLIEGREKQAAAPAGHSSSPNSKQASLEDLIEKLAARMKEKPDDAEGWFMLGRSYMSMGRYKEAVDALEKTNTLVPNNPVVMLRYADALTTVRGGQISGKPFELIKRAVELSPDNQTGLWLLGMGYEEQGAYKKAISYWNQLLPLLEDEQSKVEVNKLITDAKRKSGIKIIEEPKTQAATKESNANNTLTVVVSIDKHQLNNVSENDIVFIFARSLQGSPMPLAVVRKQVKDLPIEVTLDDTMAMTPAMKLSSFTKVQVVARISKSGSAKAQRGDIQSEVEVARAGQKEKVALTINKILP